MKPGLSLLFCLFCLSFASAQNLSGWVTDENRQPVPGATVYLNGTSIWAITDENGRYELQVREKIHTELVVTSIGYESFALADPFAHNPAQISLKTSITKLQQVNVQAPLFTRKQMLACFRREFLGSTKAGKSCKISNEDDLRFEYDPDKLTLTVSCDNPVIVQNNHLGFEMDFMLADFYVQFNRKSLDAPDIHQWLLSGTTLYKEFPKSKKYDKARAKSYEGSQLQFFRLLTRHALGKNSFGIYKNGWPANPDDCFKIENENGLYKVTVINPENKKSLEFSQSFTIKYKNGDLSSLLVKVPTFHVDHFGNYDSFDSVIFSGEIVKKRAGDLLPADYAMPR